MDIKTIKKEIERIIPDIRDIRHHLHSNPELSLKETATSAYIKEQLSGLYLDILPPFLETDVVAMLNGHLSNRNITLRADMDALPIHEESKVPYRSCHTGVMHACGHDGHTSMLIGAARVLERFRKELKGSVRFVFQPGEEVVAAGKDLVEAGVLETPKPDAVLAIHAWPGKPLGSISSIPGPIMAGAGFFKLTINGRGGHGSRPDQAIDPIHLAANIMQKFYKLPSIKFSAMEPVVISICRIKGGSNSNSIPDEVEMEGTCRYFNKNIGDKIPGILHETLRHECELFGATYDLDYRAPYLPTVNTPEIVSGCKSITKEYLGANTWVNLPEPVMASEDFSYYIDHYPGAMFFLGMGENSSTLHSSTFDFNDRALSNGILFLVVSTMKLMNSK